MQWQLEVEGMKCGKCAGRVREALLPLVDDASQIDINVQEKRVHFTSDSHFEELSDRISNAGYKVVRAVDGPFAEPASDNAQDKGPEKGQMTPDEPRRVTSDAPSQTFRLDIEGMTCASCVSRVHDAIESVGNITDVQVNFASHVASFRAPADVPMDDVHQAITKAGYAVATATQKSDGVINDPRAHRRNRELEETAAWKRRWILGALLTVPIMYLDMITHFGHLHLDRMVDLSRLGVLTWLTAMVLVLSGAPFFINAVKGLRHGNTTMDTLVALGTGVAFVWSTSVFVALLFGHSIGDVYFEGAAMIVTLIALGKWLELKARGKASEAIDSLVDLSARNATVLRDGQFREVPIEDVRLHEHVRVQPGEKIPLDGRIIEGTADIDESMMTGESVPVRRQVSDEVFGATINTDGHLIVEVLKIGQDTALARIIQQVEEAQQERSNTQRKVDRISAIFVPVVLGIALLSFLIWFFVGSLAAAILPAVAVLIVACPCALGLATPMAIMVGTGRAAATGVLIRSPQSLERARALDAIVFDKTGTLTTGIMEVDTVHADDEDLLLGLAASLETGSEHPIGKAIVKAAEQRELALHQIEDFRATAGFGVRADVDGKTVRVGRPDWFEGVDQALMTNIDELRTTGRTVVVVEEEGKVLGWIALRDGLKEDAPRVVEKLRTRGIDVWMLTGDARPTALFVARELGIPEKFVLAGVKPDEKAAVIKRLQQEEGLTVAMIGDGINDAPALTVADIGIAVATGTDVAIESADITLLSDSLDAVVRAIDIARATHKKIHQNLFWAFIYNSLLIPVAALGLLQPMFAAAAMAASSVSVVSNSLLLRRAGK